MNCTYHNSIQPRLEEPETDLFEAPVCKNKGAKARLYDNTCRCARYFPLFYIFLWREDWESQNGYTANPSVCIQLVFALFGWIYNQARLFIALCQERCVSSPPQWFSDVIIWIHLNKPLCIKRDSFFPITFIALLQVLPFGIDCILLVLFLKPETTN